MREYNLSIIIPHFNSPHTLTVLLDSILKEANDGVQVIVVDDNSTKYQDEYEAVRAAYESDQCLFLTNNTGKKGAGASRNVGLDHAKGQWLLFADSDDYLVEGWFAAVSDYFLSKFDLIFFLPTSLNLQSGKAGTREKPYTDRLLNYLNDVPGAESRLRFDFNVPWTKMINKTIVDENKIRFDETRNGDDAMFSAKVGLCSERIKVDERILYCVTEGENTLTSTPDENAYYIRTEVFANKYLYLREHLTKKQWEELPTKNEPLKRLYRVIQRRYGLKALFRYIRLFRTKGIPIITKYTFMIPFKGM